MDFEIISQEYSLDDPLSKLPNGSALLNKMAARAKNKEKTLNNISSQANGPISK